MKSCINLRAILTASSVFLSSIVPTNAEQIFQLKNGLAITGSMAEVASLQTGFGAAVAHRQAAKPIWLIDDGYRRHYVHGRGMSSVNPIQQPNLDQSIEVFQPKSTTGRTVDGLGTVLGTSPFNDAGRRRLIMRGPQGPIDIIQGIVEVTPRYTRLEAVHAAKPVDWEMRLATNQLSSGTLNRVLLNRENGKTVDGLLEAARLYIASQRFGDAKRLIERTIRDYPEEKRLERQIAGLIERQSQQLLQEAKLRASAGQFRLAAEIYDRFPLSDVDEQTRIEVIQSKDELAKGWKRCEALISQIEDQIDADEFIERKPFEPLIKELKQRLDPHTAKRLNDYARLKDSESLPLSNRIALAFSNWMLGPDAGIEDLRVVQSMIQVRRDIREFLADPDSGQRKDLLDRIRGAEAGQVRYIAELLPRIEPPLAPEDNPDAIEAQPSPEGAARENKPPSVAGYFEFDLPSPPALGDFPSAETKYSVQLPPEYSPSRSYPTLLVLHPTFWTQENHLEWWCGRADDKTGERQGYPSRHGIIVVSPRWSRQEQPSYEYTPAEQERVLRCLRHAMRRFSIDADRITIAGLGEGGAAAWDIALSHPDMWAGLVTISATADKTIRHYKRNSHYIPMYHVMGELDKTKPSGGILEEYMTFKHNAMVVAYRGRGKEYFFNEVPRICEWVANADNRRIPAPSEFEVDTMRGSDVSFWWLKVKDMPQSASIDPILWDRRSRIRSLTASGRLLGDNGLSFGGPGDRFEVSLAPTDGVRFDEEIRIKFGSRSIRYDFDNDIETILMDTKTRADRRRPVWMRMQVPQ